MSENHQSNRGGARSSSSRGAGGGNSVENMVKEQNMRVRGEQMNNMAENATQIRA
jgi:hypothetical protein